MSVDDLFPPRSEIYYNEAGFLSLMRKVLEYGNDEQNDRTNVGTKYLFGETVVYELYGPRIPMMTTRHIGFKTVLEELLFFLRGDTDSKKLKSKIWVGNSMRQFLDKRGLSHLKEGTIGAMYGWIWRYSGAKYVDGETDYKNAGGVDQIDELLNGLLCDPSGRRHLVTSWVPQYLNQGCLAPCHVLQQYQLEQWKGKKFLNCIVYQRSADLALATMSFNALSYAILLNMICAHLRQNGVDVQPGKLVHVLGNAHVYLSHVENVKEQITRQPFPFPELGLTGDFSRLENVTVDQFRVVGYKSHGKLEYPMAV